MIDSHQHFWKYNPSRDTWIDNSMQVLQRDFLPEDLEPLVKSNGVKGCVAVQADQSEEETMFLLDLATQNKFINGVVGWVDLRASNISERLAFFKTNSLFKGVRHIVQVEAPGFLMQNDFLSGMEQLQTFGCTYDLLIYEHQLEEALAFVKKFPNQLFVIDHMAKPKISKGVSTHWKKYMEALASHENVYCKLSGMVTETDFFKWNKEMFYPFLDVVVSEFGTQRIMFGSDWPVCLLSCNYNEMLMPINSYFQEFSLTEKKQIMHTNAVNFYSL
ncbi:amidohydrolase family protein [Imtechella halotolerans]|uniref:Amidohydrolase n=1 Tax=Imtechella halotolerans K1 TaxID=946077 RepID=I0WDD8_9FLAO|nr:amidohydrolase family protein [Imtechella halotolerans]EID74404.1 amidohydrolase [Imtechella halotolerans K1]WMQ62241.1 amidohydrolase family protein [Imtechella halotolerans]